MARPRYLVSWRRILERSFLEVKILVFSPSAARLPPVVTLQLLSLPARIQKRNTPSRQRRDEDALKRGPTVPRPPRIAHS